MSAVEKNRNIDQKTVDSFGKEWVEFDQEKLTFVEASAMFRSYFDIFPWDNIADGATGFDMGCGSGRWAKFVAPRVGTLICIDPAKPALDVAKNSLSDLKNVRFICDDSDTKLIPKGSQDFGYSLGVLHHIPNTEQALKNCVRLLKPGAPFLLYLYYRFDNRPFWYAYIWKISEIFRYLVSRLPNSLKSYLTNVVAVVIYWPLARIAKVGEIVGLSTRNFPLYGYRNSSFYSMRTDARDRFGTPLEKRFTRPEILALMERSGLKNIKFSDQIPYWCAVGFKEK